MKNEHFTAVNMAFKQRSGGYVYSVKNYYSRKYIDPNLYFHRFPKNDERFVRESTLAMRLQSLKYQMKYKMKVCSQGEGPSVMLPGPTS